MKNIIPTSHVGLKVLNDKATASTINNNDGKQVTSLFGNTGKPEADGGVVINLGTPATPLQVLAGQNRVNRVAGSMFMKDERRYKYEI